MTFGRSEAEFWAMTPAQIDVLLRVHRKVNSGGSGRRSSGDGDLAAPSELFALASMKAV